MNEIDRLRQRLKNVNKGTVEYRMTVDEAKQLLLEIDLLIASVVVPSVSEQRIYKPVQPKILDGGTF